MPLESGDSEPRRGKPEVFLKSAFSPMFSPDGRWIAYSSNDSGTSQVYVRAYPDKGGKWQISNEGGSMPVWSRNGSELFFVSDNRIMVVSYAAKGDSFVAVQPRVWSEKRLRGGYSLSPDGKRVVALMPVVTPKEEQSPSHVVLLENFFDELRRKLPLSK